MGSSISMWNDAWNDIIRDILFQDEELKRLMMLPEGTTIIDFIDRYFIRAGYTNKLLRDEAVRIVYSQTKGEPTAVSQVLRNEIVFDIYVKTEHLHNATKDRLQYRSELIANRLYELLTQNKYVNGFNFWSNGTYDLGTRTIGYSRHCLAVGYMRTY